MSVNDVVIELVDASLDPLLCVCVSAAYPVKSFAGRKRIIISTTSLLGTKNPFLGIGYIVVGCVVLMLGIVFLVIHIKYGKRYSSFFLFCLFFFQFSVGFVERTRVSFWNNYRPVGFPAADWLRRVTNRR